MKDSNVEKKLESVPAKPGCYLFKDQNGAVIYVGKAAVLRQRVRSYFQPSRPLHPKLTALVRRISDIEWIITDSEVEALILENNLIKEHKPRYNVSLKDDKSYPYIRITNEDFPRIFITRKIVRDGSEYFGPYTNVKNVRNALRTLQRIFPTRSCKYDLTPEVIQSKKIPLCLDYYIHNCKGPCQGLQTKEEYGQIIDRVRKFLKGKTSELIREIRAEMQQYAERLEFEEAARVRNRLELLENYRNTQKVVQNDFRDRDIVAVAREGNDACAVLFKVREGKIIHRVHYYLNQIAWAEEGEILESFLKQYYTKTDDIPQEIDVSQEPPSQDILEQWLHHKAQRKVIIRQPRIGEKKKLVEMTQKNARYLLDELKVQKLKRAVPKAVTSLQKDLKLPVAPRRMECFDISNIQGTDAVASMVCFVDGKPKKSEYRKYKIRTKDSPDDFAMMREVITRRYRRLLAENKPLPDLIVVDGGKGQLSSAVQALRELGVEDQPIIGLAKRLEEVFLPNWKDAQMLPHTSPALRLLQHIRDEAHRFAVTFHRKRRQKRTLRSELDDIPGIGVKRRQQLLQNFGSVKEIKQASLQELIQVGKIPASVAREVWNFFHKK